MGLELELEACHVLSSSKTQKRVVVSASECSGGPATVKDNEEEEF